MNITKKYKIDSIIKTGGQATIYKALRNKQHVCIKKYDINHKLGLRERIQVEREAFIMKSITSQYIAKFHESYREQNAYFNVMDYMPGITLSKFIQIQFQQSPSQNINVKEISSAFGETVQNANYTAICVVLFKQLLQCLSDLHNQNVMHRDVKPDNIIVNYHCGRWTLKLIDFGFATNELTSNEPFGTIGYAAPEITCGVYDNKVDAYAAGCVMFEMFTGQRLISNIEGEEQSMKECTLPDNIPQYWSDLLSCLVQPMQSVRWSASKALQYIQGLENDLYIIIKNGVIQKFTDDLKFVVVMGDSLNQICAGLQMCKQCNVSRLYLAAKPEIIEQMKAYRYMMNARTQVNGVSWSDEYDERDIMVAVFKDAQLI